MNTMLVTARPLADAPPIVDVLGDPHPVTAPGAGTADDPVVDAINYVVRWHCFLAIPHDC